MVGDNLNHEELLANVPVTMCEEVITTKTLTFAASVRDLS
jgi:hypothetical protein